MAEHAKNGTWQRVVLCVMGIITLFTSGWAASSTTLVMDVRRIDSHGSQKSQALDVRVSTLESTVNLSLRSIEKSLTQIDEKITRHMEQDTQPKAD